MVGIRTRLRWSLSSRRRALKMSALSAVDPERWGSNPTKQPTIAYSGKFECVKRYRKLHDTNYSKLVPLAEDFIRLSKMIQLALPPFYNQQYSSSNGGRFWGLKGNLRIKGGRTLPFTGETTEGYTHPPD